MDRFFAIAFDYFFYLHVFAFTYTVISLVMATTNIHFKGYFNCLWIRDKMFLTLGLVMSLIPFVAVCYMFAVVYILHDHYSVVFLRRHRIKLGLLGKDEY